MEKVEHSQGNADRPFSLKITVRTIDYRTHAFILPASSTVYELKLKIRERLSLEPDDINLLYKGSSLVNDHTLSFYNIRNESVVNMLATSSNIKNDHSQGGLPSANNQSTNDGQIITNILKQLTETAITRRDQRLKAMQCRSMGFSVLEKESLEVVRQNLLTTEQLFAAREEQSNLVSKTTAIYPFNNGRRKFELGQWIDVKDTIDQWLEAEVIDVRDDQIKVHYNGWGARWDEWIEMSSSRIAFFRNKTVQPHTTFYLSPVPQSRLSGNPENLEAPNNDRNEIFKRACLALKEASGSFKTFIEMAAQRDSTEVVKNAGTSFQPTSNKKNPIIKYKRDVIGLKDNKSHLSLKFNEKELNAKPTIDDSKSLRLPNNSQFENELLQKKDSIIGNSPRSSKSIKSQLSSHFLYYNTEQAYEDQREIIEEDLHREISSEFEEAESSFETDKGCEFSIPKQTNLNHSVEEPTTDQILALKAAQLAPVFDRIGRALIDLAPHVAAIGQEDCRSNTDEVSLPPVQPNILGIFNRFIYEGSRGSNQDIVSSNNLLFKHPVRFQVPVMLTPGEIINTVNPSPPIFSDNFIDLNLHAVVRNERRGSSAVLGEKSTQTDS